MADFYKSIGKVTGTLEAMELEIEQMILNGDCESGNRYLEEAAIEIKCALSDLSDAKFEISTSPVDEDWDDEDDGAYNP